MSISLKKPYSAPTIETIKSVELPMTDAFKSGNLGEEEYW